MFTFLPSALAPALLLALLGVGGAHPAATTTPASAHTAPAPASTAPVSAAPVSAAPVSAAPAKASTAKTAPAKAVRAKAVPARKATAGKVTACETALAYLHAHGNPIFSMRCEPGSLANGLAAVTCWKTTGLGVSCPDGGIVVISQPSCAISYENEASNSWLDFSTLTVGAINDHNRHDASGRIVDPFGECG